MQELNIDFHYEKLSYAIYNSQQTNQNDINHEKELFCDQDSKFFVKYSLVHCLNNNNKNQFQFPFPTYGALDNFWTEQKALSVIDKNELKLRWILQLTQGLHELHKKDKYFGNLSSKCITIDDQKNAQYTFLLNPPYLNSNNSTISDISELYLPPEYYNDVNKGNENLQIRQQYDVYALGILMNGIIQENFPSLTEYRFKNETKRILSDPVGNDYPKKNNEDPFWKEFTNQIIDQCLNPNKEERPGISNIYENLQKFLSSNNCQVNYVYNDLPVPIMQSSLDKNYQIPSLIQKQISFLDVANTLQYIEDKYKNLDLFFESEIYTHSPFPIKIPGFDFHIAFVPENTQSQGQFIFTTFAQPRFKDDFEEEGNLYEELEPDQFLELESKLLKSKTIKNFYYNNIPFFSIKQFFDTLKSHNDIIISSFDVQTWLIYLSEYMIQLEGEGEKTLLPLNFSSESVLVSLLTDISDKPVFQLSIFPFPVKQTALSKIYHPDLDEANINFDIYAFGVLMFEILSKLSDNDKNVDTDFDQPRINDLYNKFHDLDPSFTYDIIKLQKISELIEKCLTPHEQPSFSEIKDFLCSNPICVNVKSYLRSIIDNCEYIIQNQSMDLKRLVLVADLYQKDKIHDIIDDILRKGRDENEIIEKDEDSFGIDQPFEKIFSYFTRCEFNFEDDPDKVCDFKNPFSFIRLIKMKDDELPDPQTSINFPDFLAYELSPVLDKFIELKHRLIEKRREFEKKCQKFKPSKLDFTELTIDSANKALVTIIKHWSPLIPHTLLITIKNNQQNINDNDNDNNDNDNFNRVNPTDLCSIDFLEQFAISNDIIHSIENHKKSKKIRMFFPKKEDIFDQLSELFPKIGNINIDNYTDLQSENDELNEENEEKEEEEEEEEEDAQQEL